MPNSQPIQQFRKPKPQQESDALVNDILEEIENANDNTQEDIVSKKQQEIIEQQQAMLQQQQEEMMRQQQQQEAMMRQQQEQEAMVRQQQEQEAMMRQQQEQEEMTQEKNNLNQNTNELELDDMLESNLLKTKDVPAESFKVNLNKDEDNTTSLLERCLKSLKSSILVGAIILVLLLPVTDKLFERLLPNKEFIQNNLNFITSVIKSLLGAIVFYFIDFFT